MSLGTGETGMNCSKCGNKINIEANLLRKIKREGWTSIACPDCWEYVLVRENLATRSEYANLMYELHADGTYSLAKKKALTPKNRSKYCMNPDTIHSRLLPEQVKVALGIKTCLNHSYW